MNRYQLYPVFLLCFLSKLCQAQVKDQSAFIEHAAKVLDSVNHARPIEKVYLQTNSNQYSNGENIWFKAYLTAGDADYLSDISRVLNVALINEPGQIVLSETLPVNFGLTHGDFYLSAGLPTGEYYLVAYTNYMVNNGPAYYFRKKIHISAGGAIAQQKLIVDTSLRFYPESGQLVNGIGSLIAFASSGMRPVVHGDIIDNDNQLVTHFKSYSTGMGSFYLYPQKGKTYTAVVTFKDSSRRTINLPVAENTGYVLAVNNRLQASDIGIRISYRNDDRPAVAADSTLVLIASSGGKIVYSAKANVKTGITSSKVARKILPAGLTQFALFNADGKFLTSRIIWNDNHDVLNLKTTNDTDNRITIKATNADGTAAQGSFSALLVKNDLSNEQHVDLNLPNYLSLFSEVKGNLASSDNFSDLKTDSTGTAADLFVLTHNFREFNWRAALSNTLPPLSHKPEKSLTISGMVVDKNGNGVNGAKVGLFNKELNIFKNAVADRSGYFSFDELSYPDSAKFSLRATDADDNGNNISVKLTEPEVPPLAYADGVNNTALDNNHGGQPGLNTPTSPTLMTTDKNARQLKAVEIQDRRNERHGASAYSANLNGAGRADYILTAKDLENQGGQLADILVGKLAGITVDRSSGTMKSHRAGSLSLSANMLIVVDGMYIPNTAKPLNIYNPSDIESIEILLNIDKTSAYGSKGANGVAIITTKHGGDDIKHSYAQSDIFRGFYQSRSFSAVNPKISVFWNPDLFPDSGGNISFSIPNGTAPGVYIVTIEGISLDGKAGSQTFSYAIK